MSTVPLTGCQKGDEQKQAKKREKKSADDMKQGRQKSLEKHNKIHHA